MLGNKAKEKDATLLGKEREREKEKSLSEVMKILA